MCKLGSRFNHWIKIKYSRILWVNFHIDKMLLKPWVGWLFNRWFNLSTPDRYIHLEIILLNYIFIPLFYHSKLKHISFIIIILIVFIVCVFFLSWLWLRHITITTRWDKTIINMNRRLKIATVQRIQDTSLEDTNRKCSLL